MATYSEDILYLQALDNYPYDVEQCIEKLQYVLGSNDHAGAHYLMGRIYDEQMQDYKNAKVYYTTALCLDHEYTPTYYYYASMLINNSDYQEAKKVLEVGFTLPECDQASLHYLYGIMLEKQEAFKATKVYFKTAKRLALNNDFRCYLDNQLKRIKEKQAALKPKKKKKTSKKKGVKKTSKKKK
jgi:tetratricopeptide (TPR) repeat protein